MTAVIDTVETWSGKDRGDENFPVGVLIRAKLRPHVHAFYDFARNGDDIADSPKLDAADKIARLDRMEAVLLGRAETGSPSATRLRASLAETGVTSRHATDLLIAFRQDATKTRYASWDDLLDYCRHSAMPVGRYVLDLHGEGAATHAPSDALCVSLQVLNHLQDCAGDLASLDRCYMLTDRIADLRGPAQTPALRAVFDGLLDRVDALNAQAAALPRAVRDRRLRIETAVIVGLAQRLSARLRRGDPIARRIKLPRMDVAFSVIAALRHA